MTPKINRISKEIAIAADAMKASRLLHSDLHKKRLTAIFEAIGLRDGDPVYRGDEKFIVDQEQCTAKTMESGEVRVAIYGRKPGGRHSTNVAYAPMPEISRCMLPSVLLPDAIREGRIR
jgi:hypothetical protein